jgi:hypothetical protein
MRRREPVVDIFYSANDCALWAYASHRLVVYRMYEGARKRPPPHRCILRPIHLLRNLTSLRLLVHQRFPHRRILYLDLQVPRFLVCGDGVRQRVLLWHWLLLARGDGP